MKKYLFYIMSVVFLSSVLLIPRTMFGCGGPATRTLDTPMHPIDTILEQMITREYDYETVTRDEFLFLYPFRTSNRGEIEPLWSLVYQNNPEAFQLPFLESFEATLKKGDWQAAEAEARQIINQVLDMPSVVADKYHSAFNEALEFLDLLPDLTNNDEQIVKSLFWNNFSRQEILKLPPDTLFRGTFDQQERDISRLTTVMQDILAMRKLDRQKVDELIAAKPNHPRIATLRFISLRNEFARKVPDGWLYDIRTKVDSETWRELEVSIDQWLKDFPHHPLFDLVLCWKTRIYYFEGNTELAWNQLLSIYPRRLPRVLYEMRYLLVNAGMPRGGYSDKIKDPILFTALLPSFFINPEQWSKWWELSEENLSKPWAINLQERLLAKTMRGGLSLRQPPSFPKEPQNPTALWGELRALSLINSCQWDEAARQIFSLPTNKEQVILAASYYLRRGEISHAVQL